MIKTAIAAAAVVAAGAPAVLGLLGNGSFTQAVPVRAPQQAAPAHSGVASRVASGVTEPADDRGRHAELGDDRGRHAEPGDDRGRHAEPRDDRGHDRHGSRDRQHGGEHGGQHGGEHGHDD